jgi:hypothetical protein
MHKHSSKAHIIVSFTTSSDASPLPIRLPSAWTNLAQGSGSGDFTWTNVAEAIQAIPENFNLDNPPYRDGFETIPVLSDSTWLAIRYQVVNPGVRFPSHFPPPLSFPVLLGRC